MYWSFIGDNFAQNVMIYAFTLKIIENVVFSTTFLYKN